MVCATDHKIWFALVTLIKVARIWFVPSRDRSNRYLTPIHGVPFCTKVLVRRWTKAFAKYTAAAVQLRQCAADSRSSCARHRALRPPVPRHAAALRVRPVRVTSHASDTHADTQHDKLHEAAHSGRRPSGPGRRGPDRFGPDEDTEDEDTQDETPSLPCIRRPLHPPCPARLNGRRLLSWAVTVLSAQP
jgi:hypothetical protein